MLSVLLRTSTPLTGRQIHGLAGAGRSLWSTQQALRALVDLGLVQVTQAGRANLHTVNDGHYAVAPLRALLDPIGALESVVREVAGETVETVYLFGSVARGEATARSDIDLAVVAPAAWDRRIDLQAAVTQAMGNNCDVVVFTPADFASRTEPVVNEILRDAIVLCGQEPVAKHATSKPAPPRNHVVPPSSINTAGPTPAKRSPR